MKKNITTTNARDGKRGNLSYVSRYRQKNELSARWELKVVDGNGGGWKKEEICERRDKIKDRIHKESDVSKMRIEDDSIEDEFNRDDYQGLEDMWNKKIIETQEETQKIRQINTRERKKIKTLEQEVEKKRYAIQQLEVKLEEASRRDQINQITEINVVEDEEEQNERHYKDLLKIIEESEKQIEALKSDRSQLWSQNAQLQESIEKLRNSLTEAPNVQQQQEEEGFSLQAMTPKIQSLLNQIQRLQLQNTRLQQTLNTKQGSTQFSQQDLNLNFDVAQKMFIIRQLQKIDQLMLVKDNELKRVEEFDRNRQFLKSKTKEVEVFEKEVNKKKDIIQDLTEQIKLKSIAMLELYQY